MNRRQFVAAAAAAATATAAPPKSKMGIATTCYLSYWRPKDMIEFAEHCAAMGAGGVPSQVPPDIAKFRSTYEKAGMFYEAMLSLNTDITAGIKRAKEAGAVAGRVGALSGRRYETFPTMEAWKKFVSDSRVKIAAAAKAAEAEKFPLALENHKDWTLEDALGLMKEFGGEYFGILLDTGNNISLLDDPHEFVEKLAPYALATHLKDMDYQEHPLGFEMSEVAFGEGQLDMKGIIATIQKARPKTKMTLEMITRNPLVVPCLTSKYWVTMPNRSAVSLAKTLEMVRARKSKTPLPRMDSFDDSQRRRLEDENVKWCLNVAREQYGLSA